MEVTDSERPQLPLGAVEIGLGRLHIFWKPVPEVGRLNLKVLVVDDEPTILDLLQNILEIEGFQVTTADSGREALERLRETRFDTAVLDMALPDTNGFLLFNEIQKKYPRLAKKVVFLTGVSLSEQAIQTMTNMSTAFLLKPIKPEILVRTLQALAGVKRFGK